MVAVGKHIGKTTFVVGLAAKVSGQEHDKQTRAWCTPVDQAVTPKGRADIPKQHPAPAG